MNQIYNLINQNNGFLMLLATLLSSFATVIVALLTYTNLKEFKKTRIDESRAYIVFYISKYNKNIMHDLVVKNFGKAGGKLLSIELTPELSYSKSKTDLNISLLTDCKNIYLAPGQSVSSCFDFRDYPDKNFNVKIRYETLDTIYEEVYELDYSFIKSVVYSNPTINDNTDALKAIYQSIEELSGTLR